MKTLTRMMLLVLTSLPFTQAPAFAGGGFHGGVPQNTIPTQRADWQDRHYLDLLNQASVSPEESNTIKKSEEKLLIVDSATAKDRATIVAIVNKAATGKNAQTMQVFKDGKPLADVEGNLNWPVSTGRETFEVAPSGKSYPTSTPAGYFRPTYLTNSNKQHLYHSVFFVGGVAITGVQPGTETADLIGKRASGGSVRLSKANAKLFFTMVEKSPVKEIPVIDRNGSSKTIIGHGNNALSGAEKTNGRDVLIIVQNNPEA